MADDVAQHDAYGVGVYHFFRDHIVTVKSGIRAPDALLPRFVAPLGVYLNGNGTVLHVINSKGDWTGVAGAQSGDTSYVC